MHFSVDLSLFNRSAHNPSFGSLQRSSDHKSLIDFCVPVNPYFPTKQMFDVYRENLEDILKYYPDQNEPIADILCRTMNLDPNGVVVVNGSTEAITWIDHLFVEDSIATPIPTFGRWTDQPLETGKRLEVFRRHPRDDFALDVEQFAAFVKNKKAKVAAICNPNNPTGAILSKEEVLRLCDLLSDLDLVIVDESFIDFSFTEGIPTISQEVQHLSNVIVVKSLGKNFGMHGVRFGYAVSNPKLANSLRKYIPQWNLNAMAETVIRQLEANWEFYEASRTRVISDREYLYNRLSEVDGIEVYPSRANFVFFKSPNNVDGKQLRDQLIQHYGFFVRECGNKIGSSAQYIRVAANPRPYTDKLVSALKDVLVAHIPTKHNSLNAVAHR